ncbi:DUF721 domain-containing protein [Limobrevibacterium gyesilva]|uniref:DUF721 domain-containing protein n=1 Tax=Limobrevibacterium gyesilva TaxID=2991712 RepID=A0AA41YN72_9PROT|nr:DUF721 domain-containing protein [Limobrevibacterium gyesilva]MCW3476999.1 DUF721 domain-containing protein [Limobrevibacterium gyesilva]
MATPSDDDKTAAAGKPGEPAGGARHVYGPRPVGALVPALTRPAFRRRGPATYQVVADWEVIVGPAIAAVTTPRKLFSGALSIACSGPMAMELQHLSEQLIGRINAHLGKIAVTRLRFIQDVPPPRPPAPKPRPVAVAAARAAVADLPPGELRNALEALGRAILTRRAQ